MNLCVASICPLPKLGVTHGSEEVVNLLLLVLRVGLDLETVNLLQNFGFLVEQQLQGKFLLRFTQLGRAFDLFGFV